MFTRVRIPSALFTGIRRCFSSNSKELEKRVALVTGSTSGIGLGIAHSLALRGCHVILNGSGSRSPEFISQLKEEFNKYSGCRAEYVAADLTKSDDVEKMCDTSVGLFPEGIDIIINNAGFQHVCPVDEFPRERWNDMITVMLTVPFQITQHLLPTMKQKGWGRIINISSVHGVRASPNKAAYVSAKHGIVGLTKVVALETAPTGITCNAICPGFVETPLAQNQYEALAKTENISLEEARPLFLSKYHPSKEAVGVDHVGEMTAFLCTEAASQITGQALVMDGGWSAK